MNIRLGGFWAAFGLLVFSPLLAGAEAGAFRFTKVEDALLRQVELAEENYEEERLILHDAELQAYVTRVGQAMLPVEGARACSGGSLLYETRCQTRSHSRMVRYLSILDFSLFWKMRTSWQVSLHMKSHMSLTDIPTW